MGSVIINRLFEFPRGGGELVSQFSRDFPRVLGTFSAFYPHRRRREVLAAAHVIVPGADYLPPGWGWSPGEIAREILRERRGRRWPEWETWRRVERLRPPALAVPGRYDDCALVDVRRAYESILLSWGVRQVDPLRYFSKIPAWDVPSPYWSGPGEKHVLRILPAVGLGGRILFQESEREFSYRRSWGRDCRPWGTVQVVLWGIAAVAWAIGAVYWNVDGGIIPAREVDTLAEICSRAGLVLRVKSWGDAEIKCLGAYRVGGWRSGHFDRVRGERTVELDPDLARWGWEILRREERR